MAKKPGLAKKYAKYGFKKGWEMKRAADRKRKRTSGTTAKPKTTKKRSTQTMGNKKPGTAVAKRKPAAAPAPTKKVGKRMPRLLTQQTLNTVIDGILIGGSAIGTTVGVNKIPVIRDLRPLFKSLIQTGSGIATIAMIKDKYAKKVGMGFIVGGAITAILPYLPEGMKVFGGRPFTPGELASMRTMGKPFNINANTMGKPVNIPNSTYAGSGDSNRSTYRSRGSRR